MIKTIKYSEIESVKYKFSEPDIVEALMEKLKIKIGNNKYEIKIFGGDEKELPYFELIIHYKREAS